MPSDEPKYFKKIKLIEKNVQRLKKKKIIQDSSNNLHVMCDL
jgi:hypothetical protein